MAIDGVQIILDPGTAVRITPGKSARMRDWYGGAWMRGPTGLIVFSPSGWAHMSFRDHHVEPYYLGHMAIDAIDPGEEGVRFDHGADVDTRWPDGSLVYPPPAWLPIVPSGSVFTSAAGHPVRVLVTPTYVVVEVPKQWWQHVRHVLLDGNLALPMAEVRLVNGSLSVGASDSTPD